VKQLFILRHAKAASDGPDGDDHSRPLTGRGRRQSGQVAAFMAGRVASGGGSVPDLVLSSTAARARQTAEAVHEALPDVDLEFERGLYEADPDDIVSRLRAAPDEIGGVMIVGHNPTFHQLALLLVSPDDTEGRARLEAGFPTATLALFSLAIATWAELTDGCGRLEELFTPTR
jgi:phosphohistidine phosphatase